MKLCISNIAWETSDDAAIFSILRKCGIEFLDIAPTKIWTDLTRVTKEEILTYRKYLEKNKLTAYAFQSILYNKPQFQLFGSQSEQESLLAYLDKVFAIAFLLGVKIIVFGSPKNRIVSSENVDVTIFKTIAEHARNYNLLFCIEPNPQEYGCNFITNTNEGIALVKTVNHPNFRLHLDSAIMHMNNEPMSILSSALPYLSHFHISEPQLSSVPGLVNHLDLAVKLKKLNYENVVSIEMKSSGVGSVQKVRDALQFVCKTYGHT